MSAPLDPRANPKVCAIDPGGTLDPFALALGWRLRGAVEALDLWTIDNRVRVKRTPLLISNVDSLRIEVDDRGRRRFSKADAGRSGQGDAKVDGFMCLISAAFLLSEFAETESEYDFTYAV
ncbi:MAG: hypothetical protein QNJ03_10885 [Dinoroseobacter sp.]|nr:hypothetical protein [Dinoroseobacter sp.]